MKIYTGTGDNGTTGLFNGDRVNKDDIRIECNGMIDEVNAFIGLLKSRLGKGHDWIKRLTKIQQDLISIMSHVATPEESPNKARLIKPENGPEFCEKWIDELDNKINKKISNFLIPGESEISSLCHVIRTKIRTTERRMVYLNREEKLDNYILIYINRLSDLFFTLARVDVNNSDE